MANTMENRLIDALNAEICTPEWNNQYDIGYNNGLNMAKAIVLKLDAVPVVRCKDCQHYRESEHPERTGIKFCYRLKDRNGERVGYNYSDNDFCSHGERRK